MGGHTAQSIKALLHIGQQDVINDGSDRFEVGPSQNKENLVLVLSGMGNFAQASRDERLKRGLCPAERSEQPPESFGRNCSRPQ